MAKRKKKKPCKKKRSNPKKNYWVIDGTNVGVTVSEGKVMKVMPALSYVKMWND